jgi:multiple sugar transport system permease protein
MRVITNRLKQHRRALSWLVFHTLALAVVAIFVMPLLWVVAASLRQPGLPPPRAIEWLPSPIVWGNYGRIFQLVPFASYALNSLSVVALAVPVTLIVASWAGFAMAQLPTRLRRTLLVAAVVLRMVPSTALWLPRFVLFKQLALLDTFWVLVVPALMGSSPLFVLLFYWIFRRIPRELFESARLDGAGLLSIWSRIAMPQAKPTIMTVAVLTFTDYWGDFMNPLLYLKSESRYTLPIGLRVLQQLDQTNWPILMAAAVFVTIPVIGMFLLVQQYFWPEGRLAGIAGRAADH